MSSEKERAHLKAIGARLLSEANDLKRTPAALAQELGWDLAEIEAVIAGKAGWKSVDRALRAVASHYPVSLADLWVDRDDTIDGVLTMEAQPSLASARIFDRPDREKLLRPYYEYRDTAMSRTGPFKPEWIKTLREVNDSDPYNPDIAFNRGHLLHQLTFFIGPVNFYWEINGRRYSAEMNTGDSNYITPFVPHSFASRDETKTTLIIAVTYAGAVRGALGEIARVGAANISEIAGNPRELGAAFKNRLERILAMESLEPENFIQCLIDSGLSESRAKSIISGSPVSLDEIDVCAAVLGVRPSDLLVSDTPEDQDVIIHQMDQNAARPYPNTNDPTYILRPLARTPRQPYLKAFDLEISSRNGVQMRHGLHQYLYNYGDMPVTLSWNDGHQALLEPGSSAYLRPMVRHSLSRNSEKQSGKLLMVRIPGFITDAVLDEFATFGPRRTSVTGETETWF
ncbi:hypothetical protein OAJ57_04630 [Alphaproteobacteria bacterium]|nr:hypothetical protein [Alphaproteobacteria bacterium]